MDPYVVFVVFFVLGLASWFRRRRAAMTAESRPVIIEATIVEQHTHHHVTVLDAEEPARR